MSADGGWGRRARAGVATQVGLQLLLLAAIVVGINWVAARKYRRWDWTDDVAYTLEDKTLKVIAAIAEKDETYQVVVFYAPDEYGAWEPALNRTRDLLEEYKTRSRGRIAYEVVPVYAVAREGVAAAQKKYDIRSQFAGNDVVFKRGETERIVNLREFFGQDWESVGPRGVPKLTSFTGEGIVTSTLQVLSQSEPILVAFTGGHGEVSPLEAEPGDWSQFAQAILGKREGYEVRVVEIGGPNGVPKDVDVLVVAGPANDLTEADVRALKLFMNAGGRLLVSLDSGPETQDKTFPNLLGFLDGYGVVPETDIVMDPANAPQLQMQDRIGRDPTLFRIHLFERKHPVTAKLDTDTEVFVAGSCAVQTEPRKAPEGFKIAEIAHTSKDGWGEKDFVKGDKQFTPDRDFPGPVPLAAAVSGMAKGHLGGETRLVVLGDSTALTNGMLGRGMVRPDLALNAVRWLAGQEHLITRQEKRSEDRSLRLTKGADSYIFWRCVVLLPLLALAFGMTMWLTRRTQ
jgi:hypothetical protein